VDQAERWMGESAAPFFAWVHLYDPHTPYTAPEPFRSRHAQDIRGAYDAEIAWTDSLVGRLLDGLAARGALDRTVVVVVGDHGEALGDHGEQTHGFFIYEETLRIPLLVAGPSVAPRTVAAPVRIVDVMPTVLDLLAVPAPPAVQGRSLSPLGRGETLDLVSLSETWYPRFHYGWSELTSIRDGRYKLIRAPRRELYDLERDPGERTDLAGREPARADAMERALLENRQRVTRSGAERAPQPVDPEVSERLEALGYVGGGASPRHLEERPRGDPKDKIGLYALLKSAAQASVEGRIDDAIARAGEALAREPGIVEGHTLLGNFHGKAGRWDAAAGAYRRALALDPEHQGALFSLALAYKNQGRLRDAEAGFERARAMDPRNTKVVWQLADIWMRDRQYARAEAALRGALAGNADRPPYLVKLGECYLEMKRPRDALAVLEEAVAARPTQASAHFNLALAKEELGDLDGARRAYEAELALDARAYRASFNLGRLLLRSGRPDEAAPRFAEAVRSNPGFGTGHLYLAKAQLDRGDLAAALASARLGLDRAPEAGTAPLGHYVLADVYTRMGRPRDAARAVAEARRLERGSQ
jgi:tetratricopeptide (TPR) repeat protein